MRIDVSRIEGYENMTPEQKVVALEEYEIDLSGYVEKFEYDRLKTSLDNATSEAADYKKKWQSTLDEKEKSALEEQEKRAEMENRLKELENEKTITEYKSALMANGYDEETALDTAQAMMSGDMVKVFANQKKMTDGLKKELKKELMNSFKTPDVGGDPEPEKRDPKKMTLQEKNELAKTDPDAYKAMYE